MPLIISVVGYSQSGKTTLLEKMIPLLEDKGYQVGVIKHHPQASTMDQPGKDTCRLVQAGATRVALWENDRFSLTVRLEGEERPSLDRVVNSFFPEEEIILTEGFKKEDKPKILVLTEGKEEALRSEVQGSILAAVGEKPFFKDLPHFHRDDAGGLVRMIEERFLSGRNIPRIRLLLDGERIPLNHFVQDVLTGGILGILSTLKGVKPSTTVEIRIHSRDKEIELLKERGSK